MKLLHCFGRPALSNYLTTSVNSFRSFIPFGILLALWLLSGEASTTTGTCEDPNTDCPNGIIIEVDTDGL